MRKAKVTSVRRAAVLLFVITGAALGQAAPNAAPQVPTDHYGPPLCPGVKAPVYRDSVAAAKAEQEQGAGLDHALLAAEPIENFEIARYRLVEYGDCVGTGGCYWADLDAQFRRAELALQAEVQRSHAEKHDARLALVMDIDETSLSSYCEMKREDFGYLPALANAWVVTPEAAVGIPGAVRLFKQAKAAGVAVFFLTGRPGVANADTAPPAHPQNQTAGTTHNLESAGFHGWTGLILRDSSEIGIPTITYKSRERQKIVDEGYRIVLSVGDQWSDLLGTPQAEVSVKLPNPFYFLP